MNEDDDQLDEYDPGDVDPMDEHLYDRQTMWQRYGELREQARSVGGATAKPLTEKARPKTRADRRREKNGAVIQWTFVNRPDVWTDPQKKAALAFYARGLNQAKAAHELGISFWSFRDRLRAAELHAHRAFTRGVHARTPEDRAAFDGMVPTPTRYSRRRSKRGRAAT